MSNKELYQRAFSNVRSSSVIRWEDYSMQGKRFTMRRAMVLPIAALLAALLCGTALAVNFLGLRDLLLPQSLGDAEAGQSISLSGYMNTPESRALAEWQEYLNGYEGEQDVFQTTGDRLDDSLARYSCYHIYAPDMARELTRIADKYGLKLHSVMYDLKLHPELLEPLVEFMGSPYRAPTYMYEDGTFHTDNGWIEFDEHFGSMDFQLQRSVRGTFHDAMLTVGDVSQYQEWSYEVRDGTTVTLALGPDMAIILCDLEDCFVTVIAECGTNVGFNGEYLETLADSLRFSDLSPVVAPQPAGLTVTETSAPVDPAARAAYAAILRNFLYSGIFPDGSSLPEGWYPSADSTRFAVWDVDGDGKEELVLRYEPDFMAAIVGYVVGYDGESETSYVELTEIPSFTFYENGAVKALWPYNRGYGEMFPYNLYEYHPETDSYERVGAVDSWNRENKEEDFPDDVDTDGAGVVYYVNTDPEEDQAISEADYLAWLEAYLQGAQEVEIPYQPLYDENIAAMEQ